MVIKDLDKIQSLLDKYFEAETTLEEEQALAAYFAQPVVDARFRAFQPLFRAFADEKMRTLPLPRTYAVKRWGWRIAAAVAVFVVAGVGLTQVWQWPSKTDVLAQNKPKKAKIIILDENSDPELALAEVEKALALVSKKMHKGEEKTAQGLSAVKKVARYVPTSD